MAHASQSALTQHGLRYWMEQVVTEAEKARDGFEADPVHDLRVAIRRCRSMAEGFGSIDVDTTWKKMRRSAKPLFATLGDLRDVQVQIEWVEKLGAHEDPVATKLMDHFRQREQQLKASAANALAAFDIGQWQQWTAELDERSRLLPLGGEVFQVMALERWSSARQLQATALRNRSKNSLHALRIGIKKFRYIVENFLPSLYEAWHKDLKKVQDVLGEVHDFDVLAETARAIQVFENPEQRQHWSTTIQHERRQRIDSYRKKMVGRQTLWQKWRADLPAAEALNAAVLRTFETWSQFRDPDITHTRRVLSISFSIFDEVGQASVAYEGVKLRELLTVAVLTHEVGHGHKRKHHKQTVHMLQQLEAPPGWRPIHLTLVGIIARYHRGALPNDSQKMYAALRAEAKRIVNLLGGIVRLSEALDRGSNGEAIAVANSAAALTIQATGYHATSKAGEQIAAARHLLESTIGVPIIIKASN
jgi:CHAD domain-containing protein